MSLASLIEALLAGARLKEPTIDDAISGGALALGRLVLQEIEPHWGLADEITQRNWRRDSVLLNVAQKARNARAESAWKRLAK